jgi:hypothetical protein
MFLAVPVSNTQFPVNVSIRQYHPKKLENAQNRYGKDHTSCFGAPISVYV